MNKRIHLISLYYLFLIVVWNHLTVFVNNYESTYTSYFSLQRNTGEDNSRAVCDKRTLCQMRLLLWLENKSNRNRKLRQEVIPHWEILANSSQAVTEPNSFQTIFFKAISIFRKKIPLTQDVRNRRVSLPLKVYIFFPLFLFGGRIHV